MEKQIKIALAGNPNCGKTTLFNALTGSNQFVGNWPGVTVEKKEGKLKGHNDVIITDLPGIYSLSPYTLEEVVARNYLIAERPDAILNIIDGTNLERNLYLTTQLTELGIPVVVAINMIDVVRKNGDQINIGELSRQLGCKVVEISALKGTGIQTAAEEAIKAAKETKTVPMHSFSGCVEHAIAHIEEAAVHNLPEEQQRWYAIKIFERDDKVMEQLTYGEEVYRFELGPSRDPQLAAFYQVIVDKGNQQMTDGDSLDNLAATADPVYERQVDELMEKIMADVDENTRARQEGRRPEGVALSDYVDYRTYLDYDIKVTNTVSGQQASLSRVSRDSSGGENQAPFYVAICASLLQIYQKSENSIRLVLLDEAFSKMTSDRIRPMMELFRRMQLQVLLISTVEKSTAIQPYCDITYSIVRHGDVNAIAPFYRLNPSDSRQEAEP